MPERKRRGDAASLRPLLDLGVLALDGGRPHTTARWQAAMGRLRETLERVLLLLSERWADILRVLMATGWHVTELGRFAKRGRIAGDVLVCPRHKSGEPHRTKVSPEALEARRRTLASGNFCQPMLYAAIADACREAWVERFGPGSLRHTVATNVVRAGNTPEEVAHFLDHKGAYMVKKISEKYGIDTGKRIASLLAQCSHESCGFRVTTENLNYSAQALLSLFPRHFNPGEWCCLLGWLLGAARPMGGSARGSRTLRVTGQLARSARRTVGRGAA